MRNAEKAGLTPREQEKIYGKMLNGIGDSLSDLATSDNEAEWKAEIDYKEDIALGKLSNDDEAHYVLGTIATIVQQHMKSIRQNQMRHDELTQPEWREVADYCRERGM
jgi:hypothetical protein